MRVAIIGNDDITNEDSGGHEYCGRDYIHILFIFTFFPFFFTLFYYLLFVVFFIIILKAGMILNTYNSKYRNDNRLGLGKEYLFKGNSNNIYIYIDIVRTRFCNEP